MNEPNPPESQSFFMGQVDAKIGVILDMLRETKSTFERHEGRIRTLENGRAWLLGAAAVVGAVVSLIITVLM